MIPKSRKVLYFIAFIIFITFNHPYRDNFIEPELKPYYTEFVHLMKEYCEDDQYFNVPHQVVFYNFPTPSPNIGICIDGFPNRFIVRIDKDYWARSSEEAKASLMFHELAHCFLDAEHTKLPSDFMYPTDAVTNSKDELIRQVKAFIKKECKNE